MEIFIKVLNGRSSTNTDVSGRIFKLLNQPKKNQDGLFITVDGTDFPDLRNGRCRIFIDDVASYIPSSKEEYLANQKQQEISVNQKSDNEIELEIKETFEILRDMTAAVASGLVKGLVISGPAGIGKSYTVEKVLKEHLGFMGALRSQVMFESINGALSASKLYEKLYEFKDNNNVLVFDDCDGILYDEDGLNVLKAALDSKDVRRISWHTNNYQLDRKDIPNSFEYSGSIIFITNVNFNTVRSPRIANHLSAIVSRCHYMDLGLTTTREKILHIKNVINEAKMLDNYGIGETEQKEVIEYVLENAMSLRECSLRSCIKVANLRQAMPDRWRKFADKNVLK